MKIAKNNAVRNEIAQIMAPEVMEVVEAMNIIVTECNDCIIDSRIVEAVKQQGLNRNTLFFSAFFDLLSKYKNDKIAEACAAVATSQAAIFDADDLKNPYLNNIKIRDARKGNIRLTKNVCNPYEMFHYSTAFYSEGVFVPRIGVFTKKFEFPTLTENEQVWMTITPNEITTMQKPIEKAHGKVLTLGCGLGYFAYMAASKPDVESVTIVELSNDVIDIFIENILPQFKHPEKINIIHTDAVEYLKKIGNRDYDYCFADIWTGAQDLKPYFSVKEILRSKSMESDCWIENALAGEISSAVKTIMFFSLIRENIELSMLPPGERRLFSYARRLTKDVHIKTPEDVKKYTNPKTIIDLIENTKAKY